MKAKRLRPICALPGGGTLEEKPMPADVVRSPKIASEEDGFLWLKPGVDRNQARGSFESLFHGYNTICRASQACDVPVKIVGENGAEEWKTFTYRRGDAIAAATDVDKESQLLSILADRGVDGSKVAFGEGASQSRPGRT